MNIKQRENRKMLAKRVKGKSLKDITKSERDAFKRLWAGER